ncbi:MAG TPA: Coq4 family protein [Kofleriaceae bacterium]|jgi:ubiquinone biosynthesis protein Coq4|nr:Coq4 family protein [Kofleriaceae bacterium]
MQTTATSSTTIADLSSLSPVERWKRAISALRKILADPDRTDQVLEFLSLINSRVAADARVERYFADPAVHKLYDEQRAIDSRTLDLDVLAALPEGTLGHAYATFLRSRGLTPEVFDGSPPGISDPRLSYLIQRMRQTHDLWHVVTGCGTDPAGEIALQAFTFAQVRAPGNAILAVTGALRGIRQTPGIMRDVIALYRRGVRASALPSFPWEDHWATPLAEVRAMLGLPIDPPARAAA